MRRLGLALASLFFTCAVALAQIPGGGGGLSVGSPISGVCTSGFVLYNNAGVLGCQNSAGGGNVSNSGTPTIGQIGVWVTATTLQGVTATGSGSPVLATSPTLTTPALGTPSALVLTNATGLPAAAMPALTGDCTTSAGAVATTCTKTSGTAFGALATATPGTGVTTAIGVNVGSAGAVVVNGGALGTPSAGVGTNITGVPISTGVSGLGTGVATALAIAPGTTGSPTTQNGAIVTGNCIKWGPGIQDAGVTCGGGGGGISFPQTVAGTTFSGGIPYFSSTTVLTSSAALTANALVVGGGAGAAPAALGSLGTTTTVLHGNAAGAPTYGAVNLNSDVSGTIPVPINAQTGTTYTVLSTDNGKLITTSNAGAIAVTLPQATGSFTAGFVFAISDIGAGTATITPTTSTINGASTLVLTTKQGLTIVSDGTNWQIANPGIAASSSGLTIGSTTITSGTNGSVEFNNSGVLGEIATTGSSNVVRATSPTLVTPLLGTPTSVTLTNATGCPIGSCISGLGTGVATAAGNAVSAASGLTSTIASGATAMGTGAISSATCATVVTATATNVATTDVVTASFNGDPTAVTGYIPLVAGMLTIVVYPTSGNVNFKVCNNTSSSVTPGAVTLNWRVVR